MQRDPFTPPADAHAPDADRAGLDASTRIPDWVVNVLAAVICFMLDHMLPAGLLRALLPSWWNYRADLPPGSVEQLAASRRGAFGNAIAWMCRRRGIGPGHKDWPELSRAIIAFGGSIAGFRPGLPAFGLQWWENPEIMPGMIGEAAPTPAADAMALLRARQVIANAPVPAPAASVHSDSEPERQPVFLREVLARTATDPPTGPPDFWAFPFCYADTNGARAWPAPPH